MAHSGAPHEKFTERVRKVIWLAREEAGRLQNDFIGTEHLLLGLVKEEEGIAATILIKIGVALDRMRQAVENGVTPSDRILAIEEIPFTQDARHVVELAVEEARSLGHEYVGTEHLLVGLIREGNGLAARVLGDLGVDAERVRLETRKLLSQTPFGGERGLQSRA